MRSKIFSLMVLMGLSTASLAAYPTFSTWVPYGNSTPAPNGSVGDNFVMTKGGTPYFQGALNNTNFMDVSTQVVGGGWQPLNASNPISQMEMYSASLAVNPVKLNPKPYVSYLTNQCGQAQTPCNLVVDHWDNGKWVTLGNASSNEAVMVSNHSLVVLNQTIDSKNTSVPYVVYSGLNASTTPSAPYAYVIEKFNGTQWVNVGTPIPSNSATNMAVLLTGPNNTLYMSITGVALYQLIGNTWTLITSNEPAEASIAINPLSGIPYMAYTTNTSFSRKHFVFPLHVQEWDPKTKQWVNVGVFKVPNNNTPWLKYYNADSMTLAFSPEGVPYIAFLAYRLEGLEDFEPFVMKLNPQNQWQQAADYLDSLSDEGKYGFLSLNFDANQNPYLSLNAGNVGTVMTLSK